MTVEEGLEFVEQVLAPGRLNQVQEIVFQYAWEDWSYKDISEKSDYTLGYIKDTGSKLWQILSEALGEKVTRHNFKGVIRQAARKRKGHAERSVEKPEPAPDENKLPILENQVDWGEAIDVSVFYNRSTELATLEQWIRHERCRTIALLGMGGIGKTALSVKLAEQVQDEFECLIWRSLRHAPTLQDLLADLMLFLSVQEVNLPETIDGQISCLMKYLRQRRCLLVLDNVESILQSGERSGRYRPGYEAYGQMIARICDERHLSCLVLTSREMLAEISIREGDNLPVRSLQLTGLEVPQAQKILSQKGLVESPTDCEKLIERYSGNPLALKITAATIRSLFNGNVSAFLTQKTVVFGDIGELLDQQFNRLSALEQQVMYWLAIAREWISLKELQADIVPQVSQRDLLEALVSLQGRSLIETRSDQFSQQPVVMEYMSDRLVRQVYHDIASHELTFFNQYALIKAQAKDYIRESQVRLILQPIKDKLLAAFETRQNLETQLNYLLELLHQKPSLRNGYAAGNLLNLFWQLHSNLSDRNFSNLTIRQAYLPNVLLQRTRFADADIDRCVFAETFGGVTSVAFSPDDQCLATSDTSGEIQIWEVATGKQLMNCKGHTHWVWAIAFSPDGQFLASASDDYSVKLWQVQTGNCLKTFVGHSYSVNTLAFSPDGQTLASSGQDAIIRLWQVHAPAYAASADTAQYVPGSVVDSVQLVGHQGRVWSVAFSPDGHTLASCSEDLTIKLWDLRTGLCQQTLTGHQNWIKSIAFSPDGQHLVTGSFDHTLKLWDVPTGCCLKTFYGHTSTVTAVSFSPNGLHLFSSSYDQTIKQWSVTTGQCTKTLQEHANRVWSIALSTNGNLASGGDDHAAKLWDLATGQCTKTIKGHTNSVMAIALTSEHQYLASGHEDQTVRLWDLSTHECIQTLRGHTNRIWSVAFAPRSSQVCVDTQEPTQSDLLATASADRTIKLWDWQTGHCLKTLEGHTSWVWSVAFSPERSTSTSRTRQLLASGSYDRTIKLWDVDAGKCIQTLQEHSAPVVSVAFSPNGDGLASSSFDTSIKLWQVETGACVKTFLGHSNSVWQATFSPDGQFLASASFDQTIKLWHIETGECLQTLTGHTGPVAAVAYSPDGQQLISGGFDQTIRVWDLVTGDCLQVLSGHQGLVSALLCRFGHIFSSSFDGTIHRWDLASGAGVAALRVSRPYEGMNIKGIKGLTEAQKNTLIALGAIA